MSDTLDINDPSLVNEPIETDGGSAEDFFAIRLPDDGDHNARLAMGTTPIKAGRQGADKGGRPFITVHLAISLFDADNNPAGMVFDRPNSAVFERNGKRVSRLHAVMDAVGSPFESSVTIPQQVEHVENVLAEEPNCIVVTQWQAQAKAETDQEAEAAIQAKYAKAGKLTSGQYYTVLTGQKKFPPLTDGGFNPEIVNPITGETIRAQAAVTRYKRA